MNHTLPSTQGANTEAEPIRVAKKQGGFGLLDFMLYLVAVVLIVLMLVKAYNLASAWKAEVATVSSITQIKAGAEKIKSVNHTGVSMKKICDKKAVSSTLCGASGDGKIANEYGGDYVVSAAKTNAQRITVSITNVDTQYIDGLADTLAKVSSGNCNAAQNCTTITVTDNAIAVTL